ncbi:hypothetical protein VDGE_07134 [Verticillium dahliae]|uniref:Peptidase M14 domain-containing protein n=1 Tax=Verticillium dahliae TaxID=27337 RepID=A0A444S1N2_VERDA|nr:hypothetical protein VDGE_07134 [Verticillium dahliae]
MSHKNESTDETDCRSSIDSTMLGVDVEKANLLPKPSASSDDEIQATWKTNESLKHESSAATHHDPEKSPTLNHSPVPSFVDRHPHFNITVPLFIWLVNPFIWWKMGWDPRGTLLMGTAQSLVAIGITTAIWSFLTSGSRDEHTIDCSIDRTANAGEDKSGTTETADHVKSPVLDAPHASKRPSTEEGAASWKNKETKSTVVFLWMMALVSVTNALISLPWSQANLHSTRACQTPSHRGSFQLGKHRVSIAPPIECQIKVTACADSVDSTFLISDGITEKLAGCLRRTPNHHHSQMPNIETCLAKIEIPGHWNEPGSTRVSTAVAIIMSYEGYQALRVRFGGDLPAVQRKLSKLSYDEWERTADDITITLSPEQIPAFKSLGLKYDVMHGDLGASINAESASGAEWKRQIDDLAWYDSYHPYDDHKAYFEELHAAHPDHSEIISTGTSYEGRDIFGIHFWGDEGPGKPAIVFHGTVHAREWITAPVIEYLTLQLLTGYRNDNQTTVARDSYDFYIFPFVNPDGFVYTQTNDRLWRKNRQPPPNNSTVCWGRDINRNWPYKWDANPNGASADPCHFGYKGEAPGDTPEMAGLHAFIDRLRDTNGIKLFIDWHSYSQYLLAPLSWNCTQYIPKLGQHINLARRATQAIREVEGTQFVFGPSCATLYVATGYSIDYAYEVGKADWAYLIELRDTGNHGFVLPPAQIRGSAEEQWAGFKTILQYVDVEDIFEA